MNPWKFLSGRTALWIPASILLAVGPTYGVPLTSANQDNASAQMSTVAVETPLEGNPRTSRVGETDAVPRPSQRLLEGIESSALRELVSDLFVTSPDIARAQHHAQAAQARAPQVSSLPDPVAGLMLFVLPPETRVGPQQFSVSIAQELPWFGTLALAGRVELLEAAASTAEVEVLRLDLLTEVRRLAYELSFLDAQERIVESEREVLVRYERAAQIRYASGTGLQQEIVRVQAQITRIDTRLLEIRERRASLRSATNRLRDRPGQTPLPTIQRPEVASVALQIERAVRTDLASASRLRPELRALQARLAAQEARIELAERGNRPGVKVALSYTSVGRRDDRVGRTDPPAGNGDDILALGGSVSLPIWRRKVTAGIDEAKADWRALEEEQKALRAEIDSSISDLTARIPLLAEHLELLNGVLVKQAREALRSAETAYSTGRLSAVDLLDAEVVLFEVRIAAERIHTDLAIALAQLERAIASPITNLETLSDVH